MNKMIIGGAVLMLAVAGFPAFGVVKLASPFGDRMVLQRERAVPVWGTAAPGESVTVTFGDQCVSTRAGANGDWRVELKPMPACAESRDLVAVGGSGRKVLRDVLVGEVWFASGQSNMDCPIWGVDSRYRDEKGSMMIAMTHEPQVRFVKMPYIWSARPKRDAAVVWRKFMPASFAEKGVKLSAVAFYYALELHNALDIPIGIVDASWGGTIIDAWTPRSAYAMHPELKDVADFPVADKWDPAMHRGVFTEVMCNTSFDWNGKKMPQILATENDSLNGVCMLLMWLLTNKASMFADVRTYWSDAAVKRATGKGLPKDGKNGIIHLINSGSCCLDAAGEMKEKGKSVFKNWWDVTEKDIDATLKATKWVPAGVEYFRGGGFSSSFLTPKGMPLTMIRISIVKGQGPVMQIAEGWSVTLDPKQQKTLMERTNPEWPCTWFTPRLTGKGFFKDVYSVMNAWAANHGAIAYGHIGADLITLASMLRIPVAMHNVPAEKVFQPHCWGLFGASDDPTGADYRACANFGPLYATNR